MTVLLIRLFGGFLGFFVAHVLVQGWLFRSSGGEGALADGMMFWMGGWIVALFYYVTGIAVGFWAIVPLVNFAGTSILQASQRRSKRKRKER